MAKKTRIALLGSTGRLGSVIADLAAKEFSDQIEVGFAGNRKNADSFAENLNDIDVVVDVSSPLASTACLETLLSRDLKIPYIVGSTGWSEEQMKVVRSYSESACVIFAPNFSLGVNLFLSLIEQAAPHFKKWGYDVIVHETHHTKKVDAPSGTAKAIVEHLGNMNPQVHATRAGNIIGTHEVRFIGENDILSLTHEALDRSIFARGALTTAIWAASHRAAGFRSIKDVIFS